MTVPKPSAQMMSGPWNEPGQKTVGGTVFPANVHDQLALGKKLRILTVVDTPIVTPSSMLRSMKEPRVLTDSPTT